MLGRELPAPMQETYRPALHGVILCRQLHWRRLGTGASLLLMLPQPAATVVFQRIDDGAVLFAPVTEIYFGLNEVGARVWELLPPVCDSLDDVCARLKTQYPDVDAAMLRTDVEELLAQLLAEGLVTPPGGGTADGRQTA